MDTITHALFAGLSAKVITPHQTKTENSCQNKDTLIIAAIAAAFPDIDYLSFWINPLIFIAEWHRVGGDTAFNGWKFDYSFSSLSGTLYVDEYKAGYKDIHHGGGEINLRYEKGTDDPEDLRWIQLITTTNPLNGATSPYIDPYPNDGKDKAPFYYHAGEIADHTGGSKDYGFGTDYDLHFYDFSSRIHPLPVPFSPITWLAELYLVELKPGKKVTFHDGIQWGWEMHPTTIPTSTPEPSSILLVATGLIGYLGCMYRRRKSLTENKPVEA